MFLTTTTASTAVIPWDTILKVAGYIIPPIITFLLGRISHGKDRKETLGDKQNAELRKKNDELNAENTDLKKRLELYEDVEQSKTGNYLIMKKTGQAICPICWIREHKAYPVFGDDDDGYFQCGNCNKTQVFDLGVRRRIEAQIKYQNAQHDQQMQNFLNYHG